MSDRAPPRNPGAPPDRAPPRDQGALPGPAPPRNPAQPVDRSDLLSGLGRDGMGRPLSVEALRGSRAVSVRDLGAVGDGRRHPLGARYRDLAAARRDYPHAVSLDDELDWAATQGAIELVRQGGGGSVVSPAGTYLCNRTLRFPECGDAVGGHGRQVNWLGEGMLASVYRWPEDLGEGGFAVLCPRRHEPDGVYEGVWQDLGLDGPGPAAPAPGSVPARMHGWGWGARRRMLRCAARGFGAGLDIVGDHCRFADVVCRENRYGVYFARPSPHLYGDLLFEKCLFHGATLAAIGIHPAAQMGGCTLLACYVGGAPYGILKEAGPGEDLMLSNSVFLNCMFEYVGNAWLADANAPRRGILRKTTFDTCYVQWEDRNRLPGQPRVALWDVHRAEHVRWLQPKEPFATLPGEAALLRVEVAQACEIVGHVSHLIANCAAAGKPFLHPDGARYDAFRNWRLGEPGEWEGRFALLAPDSPPVRPAEVLEWAPAGRVRRGTASATPAAGIALLAASPGGFTVAAIAGPAVAVRCPSGRVDGLLAKGPDGTAVPAAPGAAALGWSHTAQPPGSVLLDLGGGRLG